MLNSLKRQVEWFERTSNSLRSVANEPSEIETDFQRGLNKGMLLAVTKYEREIEHLRKLVEGYMIEDVDLSGGEEDEAV